MFLKLDKFKQVFEINDSECEKLLQNYQEENGKHFPCEIGK